MIDILDQYGRVCATSGHPEREFRPPTSASGGSNVAVARVAGYGPPGPPPSAVPGAAPGAAPDPPGPGGGGSVARVTSGSPARPPRGKEPWKARRDERRKGPQDAGASSVTAASPSFSAFEAAADRTPAQPVHLETMVMAEAGNTLCLSPLIRAGWDLAFTAKPMGSGFTLEGPRGSRLRVPLRADAAGTYYLDLVPHRAGWIPYDASLPQHRAGRKVTFLVDTGAEVTLVGPESLGILAGIGTVRARTISGFAGAPLMPLHTGYFVIYPPDGAVAKPPIEGPIEITFGSLSVGRVRLGASMALDDPADAFEDAQAAAYQDLEDMMAEMRAMPPEEGHDAWDRVGATLRSGPFVPITASSSERLENLTAERRELVGHATLLHVSAAVRRIRASAFPPLLHPETVCDRFNCVNAAALRALVGASPRGLSPDLLKNVDDDMEFCQGAAAGLLKAPPIHAARHELSQRVRDASPPGHVWWTDLSNAHPADFEGHTYSRVFAEERTSVAMTFYTASKSAASLITHLDAMARWIRHHVPGGQLAVLRCDFASEAVRQGHGDDVYVQALQEYQAKHPGFRIVPVAPRSQALNRAENTWGRIHGHSFLCARRARLGSAAWSIVERGAVFIHNNTPAPYALDSATHKCSRWEALTMTPTDMSTMLGFVGQLGYTHRPGGKTNAHRSSSEPVLYVCPSTALHAQLVFNLTSFKFMVVGDVHLTIHPLACSLLLAGTALHKPFGWVAEPSPDEYASRLNKLLDWRPIPSAELDTMVVDHDPIDGLPTAIFPLVPALPEDGTYLLLDPMGAPPDAAPPEGAAAPPEAPAPAGPSGGSALAAPHPEGAASWVPTFRRRSKQDACDLVAAAEAAGLGWPLRFRPGEAKSGVSKTRFAAYRGATTLGEYQTVCAAFPRLLLPKRAGTGFWKTELLNDLRHGLADICPSEPEGGATARVCLARRGGRVRTVPLAPAPPRAPPPQTPREWPQMRASLALIEQFAQAEIDGTPTPELRVRVVHVGPHGTPAFLAECKAEADEVARISALEPSLLPGKTPVGPVTEPTPRPDGRYQTEAYREGVRVLRVALAEDYGPTAPGDAAADLGPESTATWGAGCMPGIDPEVAFMASPVPPAPGEPRAPTAPTSVKAARDLPDFRKPRVQFRFLRGRP